MKIFCPQCAWKPHPEDLWVCWPGCGHEWHTFDTRAQCPNCLKQWKDTQCLACDEMSPHPDWYHDDPEEKARWERLQNAVIIEPSEPRPENTPSG